MRDKKYFNKPDSDDGNSILCRENINRRLFLQKSIAGAAFFSSNALSSIFLEREEEGSVVSPIIYKGDINEASPELETVFSHLMKLVDLMNPTYFVREGLEATPPKFILREPLDTQAARFCARSFPLSHIMPDGDISVVKTTIGNIPAEWITAEGADSERRMLYLHGGGYALGDVDSYRCFIARLSKATGCAVLAIDYRLAPEHSFPAALDDAVDAYKHLLIWGPNGKSRLEKVFVVGDSAGGGLALTTTYKVRDLAIRKPDAVVAMSPATDLTQSGSTLSEPEIVGGGKQFSLYYANHDPKDPLVSPLYGDPTGLPPMLLQAGETEGYLDDSVRFAHKAHKHGVDITLEVWRHMPHVHQVMAPVLPEANQAIASIGDFLRRF